MFDTREYVCRSLRNNGHEDEWGWIGGPVVGGPIGWGEWEKRFK